MTNETSDEHSIWERVRRGDADAFGAIFDLHHARVFRQARRLTETTEDAEDVTALVFLEAWRRRDAVRVVDGSVIAWLSVTANNLARNARRSRNRSRALLAKLNGTRGEGLHSPDHSDRIGARLDREAALGTTHRALARMPSRDRDVIALCLIQGLSTAEAAAALGVAPGTVKSRLSRARHRLSAEVVAALETSPTTTKGTAR
ncbi:RNA polymerase sigma factor [Herbiconiux sp. CPCC 203407]|uniref:RNA polymerase sigma factor n=1 Tax=Herbiconiux oxytropis TaxID=2970915 RepID=A0AA41XH77_9MICO|nr:RNA polymerase sigma factor [Herbiconiux oxytropis]MCS5723416.1 RNA polymerase sigma factor [Herbiconiux oxytropis]MCS5727937.1 RNA polymerase sigma factor [Herbiconiux oxytropis]